MTSSPGTVRAVRGKWDDILLVCGKCERKLGGGFGKHGASRLGKVLRKAIKRQHTGRIRIVSASCMKVCPKGAVTVVRASDPRRAYLVPAGAAVRGALAALGLRQRDRADDAE